VPGQQAEDRLEDRGLPVHLLLGSHGAKARPGASSGILGGTWHVGLYAESIGGGFEGRLAGNFEPVVPGQTNYSSTITVPGGTLPNDPSVHPLDDDSSVYKLVVVLRHHNGNVTTSITALSDGPIVLVR
jgi:hypothetical protein